MYVQMYLSKIVSLELKNNTKGLFKKVRVILQVDNQDALFINIKFKINLLLKL